MTYTKEQIEEWKSKSEKWDTLKAKIATCYEDYDDEGNVIMSKYEEKYGSQPDLGTIGEMAASAYNFL